MWWRCGTAVLLLDEAAKDSSVNEAEQKQSLEDGIAQLGCLQAEVGGLLGRINGHVLHLAQDIQQLRGGDGGDGLTDGIGRCQGGRRILTCG